MKAILSGETIAKSDQTILLEGSYYFPLQDVNLDLLVESETRTQCPIKGIAYYFHVTVNDETTDDAAWSYPNPEGAFTHIQGYVAFWRGIEVSE